MAKQRTVKTWTEYFKNDFVYAEGLQIVKNSDLAFVNPQENRKKRDDWEEFYNLTKSRKQVTVTLKLINHIKSDAKVTFGLHLASLSSEERVVRIVNVLAMFVTKNPGIGYHFGMTYLVGFLLSVFSDEKEVFVVFCHLMENVFPAEFFSSENREIGLHRELRTVAKMAEVLRPKLINTLKLVFTLPGGKKKETDLTAFYLFMKRTAEGWIRSLFVPYLILEDTYRVWDCIFVYGYEFIVKFSLCLLSYHETFIKNTVKQETKSLNLGIRLDSLIIAGNLTRIKLFRKLEKLPLEKMLKKSMKKNTYTAVKREKFLQAAESEERDLDERIKRIRQTKMLVPGLDVETVRRLFGSISSLALQNSISRGLFFSVMSKELSWSGQMAGNVFNTLDQRGEDTLPVSLVNLGLAILSSTSLKEKLSLCFCAFNPLNLNELPSESVVNILISLEEVLDFRSSVIKKNKKTILEHFDESLDEENFISAFLSEPGCEFLVQIIKCIENDSEVSGIDLNIAADGYYSDTHSPLRTSGIQTPNSDLSFTGPDPKEIEDELQIVKKNYEEVFRDDIKAIFHFTEEDFEGIKIDYKCKGKIFQFFVGIGKMVEEGKQKNQMGVNKAIRFLDDEGVKKVEKHTSGGFTDEMGVNQSDVMREIDFPEGIKNSKERSGCSRLCSTQNCRIH